MSEGAERIWWARFTRAAERQRLTATGGKVMSDWAHDMLAVIGEAEEGLEIVTGRGWQPVPPERRTEEYVQRERRRLTDELGARLGVGPMP